MSKIAFLFPGQGSQAVGMGKSLYDNTEIGKKYFDQADEHLGRSLSTICFDGPEDDLKVSANTQPALLVVSAILNDLMVAKGVKPEACAGHSLGEYSALYAAGALDFATAVSLVSTRGAEMSAAAEANPGKMAAVIGLGIEDAQAACEAAGGVVLVANDNCPGQLVLSGDADAVERACEEAKARKAKRAVLLPVQGAYHSPLMQSAVEPMKAALAAAEVKAPAVPVIANVTAQAHGGPDEIRTLLGDQITSAVRWTESIQALAAQGFDTFIELGQGNVLATLMRRIDRGLKAYNVQTEEDVEKVAAEILG